MVRLGTEGTKLPLQAREDRPSFVLKEYGELRGRSHRADPANRSLSWERRGETEPAGQSQLWPAVLSEESWQGWKLALYILYSLPSPG